MKTLELTLQNPTGLHARPAKVLVNLAKQFKSDIAIFNGEKKANAKSMVSILTLGATCGTRILIQVNGEDEETALAQLEAAFLSGLGDEPVKPSANASSTGTASSAGAASVAGAMTPVAPATTVAPVLPPAEPGRYQGVAAAPGIAVGPVFHFRATEEALDLSMDTPPVASISLQEARDCARDQLTTLARQMKEKKLAAEAAIFEAHVELMDDPDLSEAVAAREQAGEALPLAWNAAVEERAVLIAKLPDPLLSARADDMRDVGRRVLRLLLGQSNKAVVFPDFPVVVIARELSPSDTAAFDAGRVLGFAIVEGGPTSHIAILARAMGLPAVVGAQETILGLAENTPVILNGVEGYLLADPSPAAREQAHQAQQRWLDQRRAAQEQAGLPATTLDNHHIDVTANAGSAADAVEALKKGADGIGLLRTEFLFLDRTTAPSEEEQFDVYQAIARTMGERPVIVRTLDIGGDKPLPYIHLKPEMNPFLGERGIRLCMNRPELFRAQLRAILRAAPEGNLRIMFPMVSDVLELRQARVLIEGLRAELNAPPVQIGIMIEVPSAALLAEKIAPEIDFFSIGTNDLTQYTLAIDRAHPALAAKHDGLHPAVLRLIKLTIDGAHKFGKRADLCGELGSDPLAIPVLVGLGMDELSVSIPAVPTVKAVVRGLRFSDLEPLARQALDCSTAQEVRELVKQHQNK